LNSNQQYNPQVYGSQTCGSPGFAPLGRAMQPPEVCIQGVNQVNAISGLERHIVCLSNWIEDIRRLGARAEGMANAHLGCEPEAPGISGKDSLPPSPDSTVGKLMALEEMLAGAVGKLSYQLERLSRL
jgi:hypothetical protein